MLERERRIADVVAALGAFPTRTGGPASLPSMADEEQCSCASLEGHVFDLEELRDRLTSPALQVVEQDGTFYLVSSTFDGLDTDVALWEEAKRLMPRINGAARLRSSSFRDVEAGSKVVRVTPTG